MENREELAKVIINAGVRVYDIVDALIAAGYCFTQADLERGYHVGYNVGYNVGYGEGYVP